MSIYRIVQTILVGYALGGGFAATAQSQPEAQTNLEEIVVSATRSNKSAASLPIKIDIFDREELRLQQTLSTNPTEMLSNLIPSYSPGRQKLTSSGESFRGRRPLFLIDGVPQSNPLRDSRRDGFTIDTEMIERVEVVFGANAIQGLGATGGIINYITKSPPAGGELMQRLSVSGKASDEFDKDGFGWRAHYAIGKQFESFDVMASASVESRELFFDGDGRSIGLDNVQGDVADSDSRNIFIKTGWNPDEHQRIQFTFNDFRLEQDGDFDSVDGDRSLGIPSVSVPGNPEGTQPVNDVTTLSLDYSHAELAGGSISAQVYYQNFAALFGGGRFGIFQDPEIAPVGELFDQSENNSEKIGTRFTYSRQSLGGMPFDLIAGFDFIRDKTFQRLAQTDRNWVPETSFFNYAPFAQLDYQPLDWLTLSGGLRWEIASLDVDAFQTIAGNRSDFRSVEVEGGKPSFDEPLFNVGFTINPMSALRLYGSYSEAFTMPDVGRVLRGISTEGTAVAEFLDLEPIITDNLEFGGAYTAGMGELQVTYFESEAGLGSRLVPNEDDIFQVRRQPTRTEGWEIAGTLDPLPWFSLSVAYSLLDGSFDSDGDGSLDADLGAADIGPDRLNIAATVNPAGPFSGRIQSFTFFDETFRDGDGNVTASFNGYTTVDASVAAELGSSSTLSLSISNLLDKQFITFFSQAATTRNDRFFAGRGRSYTLRLDTEF